MTPARHSVSVAGIVVDHEGRVLMIQRRDTGAWQPPGGVLELGETFEQGLRREVLEETRVDVTVERLTGVYKNLPRGVVALVFRCQPVAGTPGPTEEARDTQWMSPPQALALMPPAFAVRVEDALSGAPAITRTHDGTNLLRSTGEPDSGGRG